MALKLEQPILLTAAKTLELQEALLTPGKPSSQATVVPKIIHPRFDRRLEETFPTEQNLELLYLAS
jgi:hypothetical protein